MLRPYQNVALGLPQNNRVVGYYWARRCRKSTTAGAIYLQEMCLEPGRTVINCSASLILGRESIGMTLSALERSELVQAEARAVRGGFETGAAQRGLHFKVANSVTGHVYQSRLSDQEFTELYESRRMELRLYFSETTYSRELILAPSVHTFRGYRALVGFDEFGYLPANTAQELIDSADAMMRDTPDRKLLFFSNLSLGDNHPWYEMTQPRETDGDKEEEFFPVNPKGHLYTGRTGRLIHRVALKDAYEAGHLLYDNESRPMSYEECENFPSMRDGWDISYGLIHIPGGASVIEMAALAFAQKRGLGQCHFARVAGDADFHEALNRMSHSLKGGAVGIGFDVATTTSATSNPSSVTVREMIGSEKYDRLKLIWKERTHEVAHERLRLIIERVRNRHEGGPARRLCVDSSNERLFGQSTESLLGRLIPVQLVAAGETVDPPPSGYAAHNVRVNYKTWLGDLEVANVNHALLALPPDDYVRDDYRRVLKDGGKFQCVPDRQTGAHGDTFDSGKLAELALLAGGAGRMILTAGGRAQASAARRDRRVSL